MAKKFVFFNCHRLLSIVIDCHRLASIIINFHIFWEVKREIFHRRNAVKWNYITITILSTKNTAEKPRKASDKIPLHCNIPVIYFSYLSWHPAWQCEAIVILVVYSSKICALIPLDYTVRRILLARRFGKVISILTGTFITPPGRHLALASLTGLPVTVLPKWTNLLSSSEQRIARQLQQRSEEHTS